MNKLKGLNNVWEIKEVEEFNAKGILADDFKNITLGDLAEYLSSMKLSHQNNNERVTTLEFNFENESSIPYKKIELNIFSNFNS